MRTHLFFPTCLPQDILFEVICFLDITEAGHQLLPLVGPEQLRSALRDRWLRHSVCEIRGPDTPRYIQPLRRYFVNHKLHRDDGPAVEYADGRKEYCRAGLLHRDKGPAVEHANGYRAYYQAGLLRGWSRVPLR